MSNPGFAELLAVTGISLVTALKSVQIRLISVIRGLCGPAIGIFLIRRPLTYGWLVSKDQTLAGHAAFRFLELRNINRSHLEAARFEH